MLKRVENLEMKLAILNVFYLDPHLSLLPLLHSKKIYLQFFLFSWPLLFLMTMALMLLPSCSLPFVPSHGGKVNLVASTIGG